jgi:hypothetical protein
MKSVYIKLIFKGNKIISNLQIVLQIDRQVFLKFYVFNRYLKKCFSKTFLSHYGEKNHNHKVASNKSLFIF